MTTRLGPYNVRVSGELDPFLRDAKVRVLPAPPNQRAVMGPPRNPLIAQLDGSVTFTDMLSWAAILAVHPNGLPAVVVSYLAFIFYYSTRGEAMWRGAHQKRFAVDMQAPLKELFPAFYGAIIARAQVEPTPFSMYHGSTKKATTGRFSTILADIVGHKRVVRMPDEGQGVVMFDEIIETAIPVFRGYLQGIVQNVGFPEAVGYATVADVRPWFSDASMDKEAIAKRRRRAAIAGMRVITNPLMGLINRRHQISRIWNPIILAWCPPLPQIELREMAMVKVAQFCRSTITSRLNRNRPIDGVTQHVIDRICEFGRAYYGVGQHNQVMWMARIKGMTTVGLENVGCMFRILGKIVVTSAFVRVIQLLRSNQLHVDVFPTGSRGAVVKAQRNGLAPFTREWQSLLMLPLVTDGDVRVNNAEAVSWEFLQLAANRGAKRVQLVGMTAYSSPCWRSLITREFGSLIGTGVTVHGDLLLPKVATATDVHEAIQIEAADLKATGMVRSETIPLICTKHTRPRPTQPRYVPTGVETTAALVSALMSCDDDTLELCAPEQPILSIAASADECGAKRRRVDASD